MVNHWGWVLAMLLSSGCMMTKQSALPQDWRANGTDAGHAALQDCSGLSGDYRNMPTEAPDSAGAIPDGEYRYLYTLSHLFVGNARSSSRRPFDHQWVDVVRMRVGPERIHVILLEGKRELLEADVSVAEAGFECKNGALVKNRSRPGPQYLFTFGTIAWDRIRMFRARDGALILTRDDNVAGLSLLPFRERKIEHFRFERVGDVSP